jgi:hypothetical protein
VYRKEKMTETESTKPGPTKTKGEKWEGVAFSWCKASTLVLLITMLQLGRFALPILAGGTAVFYIVAHFAGQQDSRCILKKPLIIAAFWGAISCFSLWILLRPVGR